VTSESLYPTLFQQYCSKYAKDLACWCRVVVVLVIITINSNSRFPSRRTSGPRSAKPRLSRLIVSGNYPYSIEIEILQLNTYHYCNQLHVELNAKMSPPNPKAKSESKAGLANAIQWLQENPREKATTASRIFDVLPQTIRMAIASTKRKEVARKAIVHRGQNRILSNS